MFSSGGGLKRVEKRKREQSLSERRRTHGGGGGASSYGGDWVRVSSPASDGDGDEDPELGLSDGEDFSRKRRRVIGEYDGPGDSDGDGDAADEDRDGGGSSGDSGPADLPRISHNDDDDSDEEEIYSSCDELEDEDGDYSCFGCAFGKAHDPLDPTPVSACIRMIDENYGSISNAELARMVHLFFMDQIYRPMKHGGRKIHAWRTRTIRRHIEEHTLEPRIRAGESIRNLNRIEKKLIRYSKRVEREEGKPDLKVVHAICIIQKKREETYKQKPTDMLFYNQRRPLDLSNAGSILNFRREWDLSTRQNGIGGGVTSFASS